MPYPSRNNISDQIALQLFNILLQNGVPRNGENRKFVSLVITGHPILGVGGGDIYVATSGNNHGSLVISLTTLTEIFPSFHFTSNPIDQVDNLANARQGANFFLPRINAPGGFSVANPPYSINGGRHCAELRALLSSSTSRIPIVAMSTFWWGGSDNPYPVLLNQINDPTGINATGILARPCEICMANEQYICMRVEQSRMRHRGTGRPMEAPF